MQTSYYPEGFLLETETNKELTSSLAGLEYAMDNGIILEAKAVLCDTEHNLYVDLGQYKGIIPRDEAVYSATGDAVKEIAVITRVSKSVCFVVTDIKRDTDGVRIFLSRREAQKMCRENYIDYLNCGDIIEASVTHMEQFGAFCDIGCGIVALLPVDCISVSRIRSPKERFYNGQTVKCAVKSLERDICRVTLTHKELLGTWEENASMFNAGETVTGIIRSIEPYGIFVELTPNLAGLAEWCDGAVVGANAAVYIKSIIPEKMKIKLVIVDISQKDAPLGQTVYFYEGDRIEEWQYSPEGCIREICTRFEE